MTSPLKVLAGSAVFIETLRVKGNGNVGIGTNAPSQKLYVNGGNTETRLGINSNSPTLNAGVGLYLNNVRKWSVASVGVDGDFAIHEDDASSTRFYIKGAGPTQGFVGIGTVTPTEQLQVAGNGLFNGTLKTNVLQILSGMTFEQFDITSTAEAASNASPAQIQPGLVVSIDPEKPGKLLVSHEAYDRKVGWHH